MRPTAHCMTCGSPKEMGRFLDNHCTDCFSAIEGAVAAAMADGTDPGAARRAALASRAHTAHRNFVDPRAIDRKTVWLSGNRPGEEPPPNYVSGLPISGR